MSLPRPRLLLHQEVLLLSAAASLGVDPRYAEENERRAQVIASELNVGQQPSEQVPLLSGRVEHETHPVSPYRLVYELRRRSGPPIQAGSIGNRRVLIWAVGKPDLRHVDT